MSKKKRPHLTGIVSNDWHLPYPDEAAWSLFVQACKLIKPDFFIVNGDGVEFEGVSRHNSDGEIAAAFDQELRASKEYIAQVTRVLPKNCEKIWLEGNHEEWLRLYIADNAPAFKKLPSFHWSALLGLDGWDIREAENREYPILDMGHLSITHGDTSKKWSGWTARAELHDRSHSILVGHCHRLGAYYFTPKGEQTTTYVGFENGCLLDFKVSNKYMKASGNWQHGFSVVSVDMESGWFDVALKAIVNVPKARIKRLMLNEAILECGF